MPLTNLWFYVFCVHNAIHIHAVIVLCILLLVGFLVAATITANLKWVLKQKPFSSFVELRKSCSEHNDHQLWCI